MAICADRFILETDQILPDAPQTQAKGGESRENRSSMIPRVPRITVVLGLAALLTAACVSSTSSGTSTTPTTPTTALDLTGTWRGNFPLQGVASEMIWTLTQTGMAVSGPVLVRLPDGIVLLNGFLTGTLSGTTLNYTISVGQQGIPSQPTCAGQLGGTMTAAQGGTSTLNGTYSVLSSTCTPPFDASGTLSLSR
jgi:hypothetical protein